MIQSLKDIDVALFLWINGKHNGFFDSVMYWASDKFFWIWFYLILFVLVLLKLKKKTVLVLPVVALMILISDRSSVMIKNSVQRVRPCHNEILKEKVHLNPDCGGDFGFVSSHAANTFALALFLTLLLRKNYKWLPFLIFIWATFVSYSRIYNGVHYLADVFGGVLIGLLSAYLISKLYFYLEKKYFNE